MYYVYKVTNTVNDKVYIGQTVKNPPSHRWNQHWYDAKNNNKGMAFHSALRKYGRDMFIFEVIAVCFTVDDANFAEIFYIDKYNSVAPTGYNITTGGNYAPMSESTRLKMIEVAKNRPPVSEETKQKLRDVWKKRGTDVPYLFQNGRVPPNKGVPMSESTREKVRKAKLKYQYLITFPDGTETTTNSMRKYCRDNNLSSTCVFRVINGEKESYNGVKFTRLKRLDK